VAACESLEKAHTRESKSEFIPVQKN